MNAIDKQTRKECVEILDVMIESRSITREQLQHWPKSSIEWSLKVIKKFILYIYNEAINNYHQPQNLCLSSADIELLQKIKLFLSTEFPLANKYRITVNKDDLPEDMIDCVFWPFETYQEYTQAIDAHPEVMSQEFSIENKFKLSEENAIIAEDFSPWLFRVNIAQRLQGHPKPSLGNLNPYKDVAINRIPKVLDYAKKKFDEEEYESLAARCREFLKTNNKLIYKDNSLLYTICSVFLIFLSMIFFGACIGVTYSLLGDAISRLPAAPKIIIHMTLISSFFVGIVAVVYLFERWGKRREILKHARNPHWPFKADQKK